MSGDVAMFRCSLPKAMSISRSKIFRKNKRTENEKVLRGYGSSMGGHGRSAEGHGRSVRGSGRSVEGQRGSWVVTRRLYAHCKQQGWYFEEKNDNKRTENEKVLRGYASSMGGLWGVLGGQCGVLGGQCEIKRGSWVVTGRLLKISGKTLQ